MRARNKQRKSKPYLSTVILGNVQSLSIKMDEVHANVQFSDEFRTCSLLCFSETWLNKTITDTSICVEGFTLYRRDRTKESGKKQGGGVCVFVNKKWSHPNSVTVKHKRYSPAVEILTVGIRPYYLSREFSHVLVTTVYVPPFADAKEAADTIASHVHDLDDRAPDAIKIITGDFNHCDLGTTFPHCQQYLTCATRKDRTIDLFYCNIQNAYQSVSMPPMGRSDHNMVHLLPRYRQVVQRNPPVTNTVCDWSKESVDVLKGCFDCTEWGVFVGSSDDVCELSDVVSEYFMFCEDCANILCFVKTSKDL